MPIRIARTITENGHSEEAKKQVIRLSLCMIVKDEEELLPQCLASVMGLVDEMVIVDTGSTDRTVEIAKSFGARVYHFDWIGDFAAARNAGLQRARGEWILSLDADEELPRSSWAPIRQVIEEYPEPTPLAVNVRIVNITGDLPSDLHVNHFLKLFRNVSGMEYRGAIHEQVQFQGELPPSITREDIVIRHYGYMAKVAGPKKKIERNLQILEKELADGQDKPFYLYHMGVSYYLLGQHAKAMEYLERLFAVSRKMLESGQGFMNYLGHAYLLAGRCAEHLNGLDKALEYTRQAPIYDPNLPDAHFQLGYFTRVNGDPKEAIEHYLRALDCKGKRILFPAYDHGCIGWKTYSELGLAYLQLGDGASALDYLDRALAERPTESAVVEAKGNALVLLGRYAEARESYQRALSLNPKSQVAERMLQRLDAVGGKGHPSGTVQDMLFEASWELAHDHDRRALELYQHVTEQDTENYAAHIGLASAAFAQGEYQLALDHIRTANSLRQDNPDTFVLEAVCLEQLGQLQEAYDALDQARQRFPDSQSVVLALADLLFMAEEWIEALHWYSQAIEKGSVSPETLRHIATAMMKIGQYEGATELFELVLQLRPADDEAKLGLQRAQELAGSTNKN